MKYMIKPVNHGIPMKEYTEICICCGKRGETITTPAFMPLPNPTPRADGAQPSRIRCFFGDHFYYPEEKLEAV